MLIFFSALYAVYSEIDKDVKLRYSENESDILVVVPVQVVQYVRFHVEKLTSIADCFTAFVFEHL